MFADKNKGFRPSILSIFLLLFYFLTILIKKSQPSGLKTLLMILWISCEFIYYKLNIFGYTQLFTIIVKFLSHIVATTLSALLPLPSNHNIHIVYLDFISLYLLHLLILIIYLWICHSLLENIISTLGFYYLRLELLTHIYSLQNLLDTNHLYNF